MINDSDFNELVERLREIFQPKTELSDGLPDISIVADMTEVTYKEDGKTVIAKAIDGNWQEIYRET